jgi:hypothetical protein
VTGRGQLPGRGAQRVLVDIDENDRGARLGECLRESNAGTAAGDKGDPALKIINSFMFPASSFMDVGLDSGDAAGDRTAPHCSAFRRSSVSNRLDIKVFGQRSASAFHSYVHRAL